MQVKRGEILDVALVKLYKYFTGHGPVCKPADMSQIQVLGHRMVSTGCSSEQVGSPDFPIHTSCSEYTLDPSGKSLGCKTPMWLGVGHKEQFGVAMDIGHLQGNK